MRAIPSLYTPFIAIFETLAMKIYVLTWSSLVHPLLLNTSYAKFCSIQLSIPNYSKYFGVLLDVFCVKIRLEYYAHYEA